jgi:hypothetical protein
MQASSLIIVIDFRRVLNSHNHSQPTTIRLRLHFDLRVICVNKKILTISVMKFKQGHWVGTNDTQIVKLKHPQSIIFEEEVNQGQKVTV